MSDAADWARGYARQADADLRAWELYEEHPQALAANCHKLLFLQMACEKLCKAHLIDAGADPRAMQTSHGYVSNPLPIVIKQEIINLNANLGKMHGVMQLVRHLAQEIEILNPAVKRGEQRRDNCEYPWEVDQAVLSPLDHTFAPLRLCGVAAGRTFLKLLRCAINRKLK